MIFDTPYDCSSWHKERKEDKKIFGGYSMKQNVADRGSASKICYTVSLTSEDKRAQDVIVRAGVCGLMKIGGLYQNIKEGVGVDVNANTNQ